MTRLAALFSLVLGRVVSQPGILGLRFAAILSAATLVCAVGLYGVAIDDALLRANVGRDPLATQVEVSQSGAPLTRAGYARLDAYARRRLAHDLGLPLDALHAFNSSLPTPVYLATPAGHISTRYAGDAALEYDEGLASHVQVVEGTLPTAAGPAGPTPIAVSFSSARALGLRVGTRLFLSASRRQALAQPLVVAAIYVRTDVNDRYWASNAGPETYHALVVGNLAAHLALSQAYPWLQPKFYWFGQTRLAALTYAGAQATLDNARRAGNLLGDLASGAVLSVGLTSDVTSFLAGYSLLDPILYILVAPVLALILYAITVISHLAIEQRGRELVLLRSRGAGRVQLAYLIVLEGLLLGVGAIVAGPLLALPLTELIGRCSGFLRFATGLPIAPRIQPTTYAIAAGVVVLATLASLAPAVRVIGQPMMALLRVATRPPGRAPRQLLLPLALLIAALYGYRVVSSQGQIGSGAPSTVLTQDPLVGASPLVFVLAIALTVTWLIPLAAALLFRLGLGQRLPPSLEMALQRLARAPGLAVSLVRLLVLTMALGVFAASVAGVVAENTADLAFYDAGSTLRLEEWDQVHKAYTAYPLAWHQSLPGVRAASLALRLESSDTNHIATDNGTNVNVLGIDPATLGAAIWWRSDLTATPLAALLGTVGQVAPPAIVSDNFLSATGLHQGDHFNLIVGDRTVPLSIGAHVRRFPTLDPAALPFVVVNLPYLLARSGSAAPSEAWLRLDHSSAALAHVLAAANQKANTATNSRKLFEYAGIAPAFSPADSPAQAGVYGVVSAGFAIAVLFALLGFVAHAAFAQRQRATEFAVLRALGFAAAQLRLLLLVEDIVLLTAGVAGGLLGGALVSGLFLPYLPLAESTRIPFIVRMPWSELATFSLGLLAVLLLVFAISARMALRRRVAGALRLGD